MVTVQRGSRSPYDGFAHAPNKKRGPAYNNADHIEQTMESILGQTFADLEVVVADHSSSDDTWERLQRFAEDPRVRLLVTPAGGGALANWNRVSEEATGEFIKLVCGDDLLKPTCIEEQLAAFEDGVVMVASRRELVDAHGRRVIAARGIFGAAGRVPGIAAIRESVRRGTNIFGEPACVMFRTEALRSVGLWHETARYLIDQATYARVLALGDFVGLQAPLAAFRLSTGQWSVRLAATQHQEAAEFHEDMAAAHPDAISRSDVRLGNVRAAILAWQRRLAYVVLGARMRSE